MISYTDGCQHERIWRMKIRKVMKEDIKQCWSSSESTSDGAMKDRLLLIPVRSSRAVGAALATIDSSKVPCNEIGCHLSVIEAINMIQRRETSSGHALSA